MHLFREVYLHIDLEHTREMIAGLCVESLDVVWRGEIASETDDRSHRLCAVFPFDTSELVEFSHGARTGRASTRRRQSGIFHLIRDYERGRCISS